VEFLEAWKKAFTSTPAILTIALVQNIGQANIACGLDARMALSVPCFCMSVPRIRRITWKVTRRFGMPSFSILAVQLLCHVGWLQIPHVFRRACMISDLGKRRSEV